MPECTTCARAPYNRESHVCQSCFGYTPLRNPVYNHWTARLPTHADCIRAMSGEELAEWLIRMSECDQSIKFCKGRPECDSDCDADRDIPQARCVECLTDWLRQPADSFRRAVQTKNAAPG